MESTQNASTIGASTNTERGMTADIKHTIALLWSTWEDLPKAKTDLQRYGNNELEILEAISDEAKTLRDRILEEREIRPSLTISGPVHEEILAEASKQAGRGGSQQLGRTKERERRGRTGRAGQSNAGERLGSRLSMKPLS